MKFYFETEHLLIRQFEIEDANRLYHNHMEEKVKKWFPNECYADINEAKGAIEFYRDCIDKNSLPFVLAVLLKETRELIGDTGVSEVEGRENEVEIGYQISDKYCGKGYATELLNAMTKFAFEHMRAEVIHGRVVHGNGASARVLEKCGYNFVNEEFGAEDDPYGNGMLVYKKVKKGSELSGL